MPANQIPTPSFPGGRIQRAKPTPFQRPSIDLSGPPVARREWKVVSVLDIRAGDILPGVGEVGQVTSVFAPDEDRPWLVTLTGVHGNATTFAGTERIYAFVAS
jgi:hypothetical protein